MGRPLEDLLTFRNSDLSSQGPLRTRAGLAKYQPSGGGLFFVFFSKYGEKKVTG